jgi:DNA-binding transcriptional MocR family regulator
MTKWRPQWDRANRPIYEALAEALARDVASGRLSAGDRLPPQRELAEALGVTVPTVTRAYSLAARRGLVGGEVGRGTFVRPAITSDTDETLVDLSINAVPPHAHLGEIAARLDLPNDAARRAALLNYPPREGRESHRAAGADWIARRGVHVAPSQVVVTSGAQHALIAALSGQLGPGDTLLVEELTYAGLLEAVRLLGIVPVAVSMDADGLRPDALDRVAQKTGARTLALQPVLHNPTGVSMPPARRRAMADVVMRRGLHVIEDDIYGMLAPEALPLVTELSSPWTYVTSLSKSVVAGVRVGFLAAQGDAVARAARAIWATTVATSPLTVEIACRLIADGTADRIVAWKRQEMRARQQLAREILPGLPTTIHPASPHVWWPLPRPWRVGDFVGAARGRGIVLGPTEGFLGQPGATPRAVRLCLGPPATRVRLRQALETLRDLAASPPESAALV